VCLAQRAATGALLTPAVTGITGHLTCGFVILKSLLCAADSMGMTTSVQQGLSKDHGSHSPHSQEFVMSHGVSREVLRAALVAAENAPDPRNERVNLAIAHLHAGTPDASAVAQAIIARILAEAGK